MAWTLARLGSRFHLTFDPARRRVLHSALGPQHERPLRLVVGMVDAHGRQHILPFAPSVTGRTDGAPDCLDLQNPEQFDRANSVTYRACEPEMGLLFEFNVHSVFYPQDERLCTMPAFYLEMRAHPLHRFRDHPVPVKAPAYVRLVLRVEREGAQAMAAEGRVTLIHRDTLADGRDVTCRGQIVSLNEGATAVPSSDGLTYELPVTQASVGQKWRLVWGAHVGEPVEHLTIEADHAGEGPSKPPPDPKPARFRYCRYFESIGEVMEHAIERRDDYLGHSRRFEKIVEQAPLDMAQFHLMDQALQAWCCSTLWVDVERDGMEPAEWFGTTTRSDLGDVFSAAPYYLAIWPRLLWLQLERWRPRPAADTLETHTRFLLLCQAYCRWSGDQRMAEARVELFQWLSNRLQEHDPPRQTRLAVLRLAGLAAAVDLLSLTGEHDEPLEQRVADDTRALEAAAWRLDHYTLRVTPPGLIDGGSLDAYTGFHTAHALTASTTASNTSDPYAVNTFTPLLLPHLVGQPPLLDPDHVKIDLASTLRETWARYGCSILSTDWDHIRLSTNLWRDHLATYHNVEHLSAQPYWDLQTMSNTGPNRFGYIDTYITGGRSHDPRGVAAFGYLLAGPRLVMDRLCPSPSAVLRPGEARNFRTGRSTYLTVNPERTRHARWPLLPLADWRAGKVPVCVVHARGNVTIECPIDPIVIHGEALEAEDAAIGGLIG